MDNGSEKSLVVLMGIDFFILRNTLASLLHIIKETLKRENIQKSAIKIQ